MSLGYETAYFGFNKLPIFTKLVFSTRGELDRRQNLIDTLTTKVRNASETSDLGPTSPRSELHAIER